MARKKQYIPQFFQRDKLAFTALSRTGIVRHEDLKQYCNLVDSRIKNYVRDGYAKQVMYKEGSEVKVAYSLTNKGRELAEQQWNLRNHYHAQPKSPYHDLQLSAKYFSLSDQERGLVRTDTEARNLMLEKLREIERTDKELAKLYNDMLEQERIRVPDMLYTNEKGVVVAYEVVTDSYGREEMIAHEAYVEIMGFEYQTTRI